MVNLKSSRKPEKESTLLGDGDQPAYPWGLVLVIEEESLAKLKIGEMPAVGTKVRIVAQAEVISVGQSQEKDGDLCRRVELQVTDMDPPAPIGRGFYDRSDLKP